MVFKKAKQWLATVSGKMDEVQKTIAFAEANHPEMAEDYRDAGVVQEGQEERIPKLLVVGNESEFSNDIIGYSIDMARRMSYEILALNAAPLSCRTFELFADPRQKKVCADFKEMSRLNAAAFEKQAEAAGIPFSHVVRFEQAEQAVEELLKEKHHIGFVVSDSTQSAQVRTQNENRAQKEIFVYAISAS